MVAAAGATAEGLESAGDEAEEAWQKLDKSVEKARQKEDAGIKWNLMKGLSAEDFTLE